MTQRQRDLLWKDLCARLPYCVEVEYDNCTCEVRSINKFNDELTILKFPGYSEIDVKIEDVKPYLFPLSSMTDEQEEELKNIYYSFNGMFSYTERIFDKVPFGKMKYFPYQIEEFFNKNHFDYRGLIPMGLANDATGLNIY